MRRNKRRRFARTSASVIAAALAASTLVAGTWAAAAPVKPMATQCGSSVPFFANVGPNDPFGRPEGSVDLHHHNDPLGGTNTWGDTVLGVGGGWQNSRMLAGPDGLVYDLRGDVNGDHGALRRWKWTGGGWLYGDTIGTGWARFTDQAHRNQVTVDEKGRIYQINDKGELRVHVRTADDSAWVNGVGDVLDTGWDKFDLIVAAGDGVLYARTPDGQLFRFVYNAASKRWVQRYKAVDSGWNMFSQIFSPGGDILYGRGSSWVNPSSHVTEPVLRWYRYFQDTDSWAPGEYDGAGKVVDTGWNSERDVSVTTNACALDTTVTPSRPPVQTVRGAASTVFETPNGQLEHFYVDGAGALNHGEQQDPATAMSPLEVFSGYQSFTGQPAAAQTPDGSLQVVAQGTDSEIRDNVRTGNGWSGLTGIGGYLAGPPAFGKDANSVLYAFAVDGNGRLWFAPQSGQNGQLTLWRLLGGSSLAPVAPTVVQVGSTLVVIALDTNGIYQSTIFQSSTNPGDGTIGQWGTLGVSPGGSAFTGSAGAVVALDGRVQVFARSVNGQVVTQHQTASGFNGQWSLIDGLSAAGAVSAVVSDGKTIELAVRGTDGFLHTTGQASPGSAGFRLWQTVARVPLATDPVILNYTRPGIAGRLTFVARDASDQTYVYYPSGTAAAGSTSTAFGGGVTGVR